jgi:hypothetical protein
MNVLVPGYSYEVANQKNKAHNQSFQFLQKEPAKDGEKLNVVEDGITTEDVLEVLIDRQKLLATQLPAPEDAHVIAKLEEALLWLNHRRADRTERKVAGKNVL